MQRVLNGNDMSELMKDKIYGRGSYRSCASLREEWMDCGLPFECLRLTLHQSIAIKKANAKLTVEREA